MGLWSRRCGGIALAAALALAATVACAQPPAPSARPLDPSRYVGRWYEVARVPNKIQTDCVAATSDWSRQDDGGFKVVQTCHIGAPMGPTKIWRGAGRIIDALTNTRFRIGFFGGFIKMDYQVLDRGDDYSWCILTAANPKFLWIMSRRPVLDSAEKASLIARARSLGYNVASLVYDSQPASS